MNKELSGEENGFMLENSMSYSTVRAWKQKEAVPMKFTSIDRAFAIAMLVCGFSYWNLILDTNLGAGVTIFAVILLAIVASYLKLSGIPQTKESIFCFFIITLSALNFSIIDSITIKVFNFIFLSVIVVYWICISTGNRLDDKISIYFVGDLINQFIVIPFSNFNCCYFGMKGGIGKVKYGRNLLSALLGFILFLPVLAIVVSLLIDADAAFENLVTQYPFLLLK
jgi:hypothetical protein